MQQNWKFQRGDIFFTHFGASTGSEQHGDRPAVILQNDVGNYHSPTLIVATMTSKAEKKVNQPTHCLLENAGLNMPSVVQAEQIFTIDKSRALKYLGHLTPEEMRRVDDAVRISLALNPMGSIQQIEPIRRSTAVYAPPEVVDGKPPVYPYTPIRSSFENAGSIEEMMLYTELQSAVHAMIQRLEYSFTFNPSLLTSPKRKQQVAEILEEAEKYIWRMHYNPFAYVHSEKDILKLVTTLMTNTKGEGSGGDPFWEKSERLLLTALIAYLHYEAPVEEQNFATLLEMLNTMQVLEDDEEYQNPVDLLFEELAKKKPNSFAGRQYKLYKLAAGDICSK